MVREALILPTIVKGMGNRNGQKGEATARKTSGLDQSSRGGDEKFFKRKVAVKKVSRLMKRTVGSLRQKARALGIRFGHRR
jgi:hypothetical protein